MDALTTLFPIFFMLGLGWICRWRGWISERQKEGANAIVFNILFPVLICQLLARAQIEVAHIAVIAFVFAVFLLEFGIGKLLVPFTGRAYGRFSPYLLTVVEGGSVALPLYLSIVPQGSTTVLFDIAGTALCFIVFPIMIARQTASASEGMGSMFKSIFTNSFVLAVFTGLFLNLSGLYSWLMASPLEGMMTGVLNNCTAPIVPMIMFILGYNFQIDKAMLPSLMKLLAVKLVFYGLIVAGFFLLFPVQMHEQAFLVAVLVYFACPPGFGLMPIIEPLYTSESDESFTSAFMSLSLAATLVIYTLIVVLV